MYDSTLDLIYVGNEKEMMMIEGSADQIPEDRFVEALEYAHEAIQDIIAAQRTGCPLRKAKEEFELVKVPDDVLPCAAKSLGNRMEDASLQIPSRSARWPWMQSRKKLTKHVKKNSETITTPTM